VGTFIERFRILHDKRKRNVLPEHLLAEYDAARRELTHIVLSAQQAQVAPALARAAPRTAFVADVVLDLGGGEPERTRTLDVGARGFAALVVSRAPPVDARVTFTLEVPSQAPRNVPSNVRVKGTARVASRRPQREGERIGFVIESLEAGGREALDAAIVDFLLARL
jgi:hypothetical protein